ncbi:cell division protein FtsQ/DivIB [Desulfobacula toluolica]|uniref:FtsQ: predicted cell division protein FtsQ n=1 Tax=Desulfobacula toluolica (strain DSM 7467 / Tol2) TaxID=651182 RepID=K0NEM6_DESTT|nr:FtsQ-type POTRA domain-containing protein [Desulfobacula toluolica]CCK79370.1 FtsQ: predicted cell division protein FtsQ [Desulfobacula toluolica Tol2]
MNKKIKPNRFKPENREEEAFQSDSGAGIDFCLKCILTVAFISVLSLVSIFVYDFITQSDFFKIKTLEISGTKQVKKQDLLKIAGLTGEENIFEINVFSIEKSIASHPWIQSVCVKRELPSVLFISVIEQKALAIVKIESLADILINTRGRPFKEYEPSKDPIENLPVISGIGLANENGQYVFSGPLFNSIMDFLKTDGIIGNVHQIKADKNTGLAIESNDIYNPIPSENHGTIHIKLGFNNFKAKLNKAKKISGYIDKNYPERIICDMDLFNIEKVFIKTKLNEALHNNLEKGV